MKTKSSGRRRYWLGGKRKPEQDRFFQEALDPSSWRPGNADAWDTCWYTGMPDPAVFRDIHSGRTVNHIPGNNSMTVKSQLHRILVATRERMIEQFGTDHETVARMDFVPRVYEMPQDYHALQQAALDAPEQRWILKPKNAARGKDVRVLSDVATVPVGERWMVQEYLENPHIMHERKYVLRLYVLISSIEPLRVYLYRQGFAKLASEPYDLDDLENPYVHLTNPDVNALNTEAEAPVVFIDLDRYRAWYREQGHDDEALFERIRDLVTLTIISARERMRTRTAESGADPAGCYELLGLDCLVDADLKPWILECNLSPSMGVCAAPKDGGIIEGQVKGKLVADMVSLLGLNLPPREPVEADPAARIVAESEAELARAGDFQCIYPSTDVERYLPFFPLPRLADMVLADAVKGAPVARPKLRRGHAAEIIGEDRLVLYGEHDGRLYETNPTAAFVWLKATDGADPDTVTRELAVATGKPLDDWALRADVWNFLADWAGAGLLRQREPESDAARRPFRTDRPTPPRPDRTVTELDLRAGVTSIHLVLHGKPLAARLNELVAPLTTTASEPDATRIEIVRCRGGFSVVRDGELVAEHLPLAGIGHWLVAALQHCAPAEDEIALRACLVPLDDDPDEPDALLLATEQDGVDDTVAVALGLRSGRGFAGGVRLAADRPDRATAIGLPVRVGYADRDRVAALAGIAAPPGGDAIHAVPNGERLRLVPATHGLPTHAYRVRAIVLLRRDGSAERLKPMTPDRVLTALLPNAVAAGHSRLTGETVAYLYDRLSAIECYALDVSDPGAALERIANEVLAGRCDMVVS